MDVCDMVGKHWHIGYIFTVGMMMVCAVQAACGSDNIANEGSRKPYSSAQKRQSPYDILRETKGQPQTETIQYAK